MPETDLRSCPDEIETARGVAAICGPASGSAKAVQDYDRRKAAGEDPVCIRDAGAWLVMPRSTFWSMVR